MKVLVTGATGFLGAAVVARLANERSHTPVGAARRAGVVLPGAAESRLVGDLGASTDWQAALTGIESVVHCAARVHVMHEQAPDPLGAFRRVNVEGTVALARQAAAAGVRRFVFISSIKVNGEETAAGWPFTAAMAPAPRDPYGISKMEAEEALRVLARSTGMEVSIVRPVLVYGPGVKANFETVLKWTARGIPLPFGSIHNRRSFVGLDNLVDLIVRCIDHPGAANETFLVSDGEDLSTTQLFQRAARAMDRPSRLVPVPTALFSVAGRAVGRRDLVQRLVGNLQVDISATRAKLDWTPPVSVDEGLRRTAAAYMR
jgi:nucleoside-diphosphate-sugar epimerase